jgi:SAM-dependent methyltransferase
MRRFRYALDPLCLLSCGLYAINRWIIRPHFHGLFWHGYSTDFLLIPAALPLILWVYRVLGLRMNDLWPNGSEIGLHFVIWSVAAEGVAPFLFKSATGDWMDVVAYGIGAGIAAGWWFVASQPGFDGLAPHYVRMEKFLAGSRLQRCRTAWFAELAGCRRILIAGLGHGPELGELLARHPSAQLTCVDASAGMLQTAQTQARRAGLDLDRVRFVHASLPAWQPDAGAYDAILTNFFLDCFPAADLPAVIGTLAAGAAPRACWIISDFTLPARGLARRRAQAVHTLMYVFFRAVTGLKAARVTIPDHLLTEQGFALAGRQTTEWGLLQADLWTRRPGPPRAPV